LQLEVGAVSLIFPSQTKFSVHLLFSSSPPPLAAFPDSKPDEEKDEDDTSEEDVRPPTQNLGLEFFLLLALGDRGCLTLIGGKESVCGIPGNINATHPRLNEVVMSLVLISDWHDINEGIILERAAFDAVKNGQIV
jgi:hypothetical protein